MKWVLFAKIKVLTWLHSFWRLWGKIGFLSFSAFRDHPHSLASGSSPSLRHAKADQITPVSASIATSPLTLSFLPPSSHLKGPLRLHCVQQDNLTIPE